MSRKPDIPVSSPEDALIRARSALGRKIEYKLGKGGFKPALDTPAPADQCDCSGYIAWCLGISRRVNDPFYNQVNGGWFETTGVYKDILSPFGFFKALDEPRVGCIAVFPDRNGRQGHIGLVTEVKDKKPSRVIHCSSSAWKKKGDAIAEDKNRALTENPSVRYGWFSGYSDFRETPLALVAAERSAGGRSTALLESTLLLPTPVAAREPRRPRRATGDGLQILFSIGNPPKYITWHFPGESSFFFQSRGTVNADGAPNAYNPTDTGSDWLLNAGRPTRKLPNGKWDKSQPPAKWEWWGISLAPGNRPFIQKANHPFPGFYISTTTLFDPSKGSDNPARFVDSNSIPFLVLPGGQNGGARKGDLGWIINRTNKKATGAIFADVGPKNEMGEMSIRAAQLLGLKDNPKNGGTSRKEILYIVFPGSGNGKPRTADEIQTLAAKLFADWGGDARVDALPNLV